MEWGTGPKLLLAFHGYSNSAGLFAPLAQSLDAEFTTVSIDLPGHGQTKWPAGKLLTPRMVAQLATDLCGEKGVERCALTAFSMGGRVALRLFEEVPQKISQMVLAAPDGLTPNWLQSMTLNSGLGARFAADLGAHPERYGKLLEQLHKRRILSVSRYQFLKYHLGNTASIQRVQDALLPLRKLTPSIARIRRQILKNSVPVHLLMGTADNVIPIAPGVAFTKDLPSAILHPLAKSHRLFDWETIQLIATLLRKNS